MNQEDPPLCANGCGFYGNRSTRDLCSKCYSNFLKQEAAKLQPEPEPSPVNQADVATVCTTNEATGTHCSQEDKKVKNRCVSCKKRVGLTGFECKCGGVYCVSHRYPEMHSCNFDFKRVLRDHLDKDLTAAAECKADKLEFRL